MDGQQFSSWLQEMLEMSVPESTLDDRATNGHPRDVLVKKLLWLSKVSDEMMQSIFHSDRQATLRTVVRHVHDLLEAESCAIFLVPEDSPEELVLEASYTDKQEYHFTPACLKIRSVPGGGTTGHIAHKGEIVRLNSKELLDYPYAAGRHSDYLRSGHASSLLGVPLKDRKERVLGVLKVENKKAGELPNEEIGTAPLKLDTKNAILNEQPPCCSVL